MDQDVGLLLVGLKAWYDNLLKTQQKYGYTWIQHNEKLNDNYVKYFTSQIEKNGYFLVFGYVQSPYKNVKYRFKISEIINGNERIPPPDSAVSPFSEYDVKQGKCKGEDDYRYCTWFKAINCEIVEPQEVNTFINANTREPITNPRGEHFYVIIPNTMASVLKLNLTEFVRVADLQQIGEGTTAEAQTFINNNQKLETGDIDIEISFGSGRASSVPWIAFLGYGQKVKRGIYPVFLYYKTKRLLILSYGISESNPPLRNWPNTDTLVTIREHLTRLGLGLPEHYGDSYIYKTYDTTRLLDEKALEVDREELVQQYKNIFGQGQEVHVMDGEDIQVQSVVELLRRKYQVILQGPPGTGKTRLAKLVAKELTKALTTGDPIHEIDEFFQTFDPATADIGRKRKENDALLARFWALFPKDGLGDMTLGRYAIGTGQNDSFCYWIERGLKQLGQYSPGSSRSYLIYWSAEEEAYHKHGRIKDLEDTTAMKEIAGVIAKVASSGEADGATAYFGDSFLLKLLHSYYPSRYAPINGKICLVNACRLLRLDCDTSDSFAMNLAIQRFYEDKRDKFGTNVTNIEFVQFLFDRYDLKGTITVNSDRVVSGGETRLIQFHPAYSYEDFVRGIVASVDSDGRMDYRVENRIVAELARQAEDNPSANYVLIVDEINRANLPAVLGELIYALEYRYDPENPGETSVESMYRLGGEDIDRAERRRLKLPKNLYVVGTMNTADRSVGRVDYAIRRRFAFVDVQPDPAVLDVAITDIELRAKAKGLYDRVAALFTTEHLAPDFEARDVQIGHSYFLAADDGELRIKMEHEVKPLLREYIKDGVLTKGAWDIIERLDA